MHIDIASVTSKGQFTIPKRLMAVLKLTAGSKMALLCDGQHLLLKPIEAAKTAAFRSLIAEARKLDEKANALAAKHTKRGAE
jgi:bifunctional DNA-binding transcriptional regulator/antitoxin component of YhaV-PrlF toxin-antitoxin module